MYIELCRGKDYALSISKCSHHKGFYTFGIDIWHFDQSKLVRKEFTSRFFKFSYLKTTQTNLQYS